MNHIYKVIWNTITQTWVAVSELSRAKGKTKSSKTLSAVVLAATSGIIISGQAQSANTMGQFRDDSSIVFGTLSYASHDAVAIGGESNARAYEDVAIGYKAISGSPLKFENGKEVTHSSSQSSVAVGTHANATHVATTAIGAHAQAIENFATAVGAGAIADHENASAFGEGAKAQGTYSTALGKGASATEDYAVALGKEASSTNTYSTSIGTKANATGKSSLAIGGAAIDSLPVKTNQNGQQYSELEDGVGARATEQDSAAIGASANATANAALAVGKMANASAQSTIAVGDKAQASGAKATSIGAGAIAKNEGTIAIGDRAKVGATNGNIAATNGIAIGTESESKDQQAIAVGKKAIAAGNNSIALGNETKTTGGEGVAIGNTANASHHSVAFGSQAKATAKEGYSSAFGNQSEATAADASAFGNTASAAAQDSTAIGAHSSVTSVATGGTALGRSSSVTIAGGVALGQGSSSSRTALNADNVHISDAGTITSSTGISDNDIKNNKNHDVYAPVKLINDPSTLERVKNTIKGTAGAVSLGNDTTTRQLTNLAPGSADSDAVNVAQLKAVVGSIKKYTVTSPDGSITVTSPTSGQDPQNFQISMNTTAVKDAAAWKIKANKEADDKATSVRGGDIVTFKAKDGGNSGDTIKISRNGKELTFEANYATIRTPGTGTVNVDNGVKDNWLAKAKNVAEAINASGWTLQANGDNVGLVNPGDKVNIATDANSGITITPTNEDAHGVSTIKLKANVTGLTAGKNVTISSKDGNYTISATDTNTQASVSKKSGSPITVTKTTTTPNSPDYAVGLDIDDKTLEIKGGKLAAKTQAQAVESVEKKAGDDNIAEVDVKSGSTKGAANAVYTVAVTKSAVKDAAAWNIKEGSETTSTAVKGGDTLTLSDTNTIDVVHNGKDFTFNAKTATIQTEQKQAITKIDVSNEGITTKTTGGNNTPTGRFIVPTGNNADKHALATAYDVADKVNQTGWNLYTNGGAPILINPGDYVNFKSGKATNANIVTEASEGATISYDVNVDDTTIKIDPNGNKLTANTVDLTVNNGKVTKPSTDDGKKLVNATTVANAVNNSYWKATRGASDNTNDDKAEGDATSNIKAGNELTFVAGKNMALKKAGNTFTYGTKDNVSFTTVTSNEFVVNPNGKFTVGAGSTINMGNNIVGGVANGVADTDAVNVAQLKANTSVVSAGDNITVTPSTNAEGNKVYTVAAKNTQATVSKAEGDNPITLDNSTTNANGTTNYKVGLNIDESTLEVKEGKLAAKAQTKAIETVESKEGGDNIAQVDVKSGKAKGDAGATYQVNVSKNTVKDAAQEAVTVSDDRATNTNSPITVTASKNEANHSTDYKVSFNGNEAAKVIPLTYKANGENAKTVKLSEGLDFTDGKGTKASVGENGKVTFDATVADVKQGDNVTINKDETTGVYTVNAKDTITTVKGKDGSAAKVTTATESTDTNKIYEVDVNVDGTTIVNEGGTLKAKLPDVSTTNLTVNEGKVTEPSADNGKKLVNAATVANIVNNSYWKATRGESNSSNDDKAEDGATSNIKAGDELTFVAGKNMALKKAGNTFTYGTKNDVSFTTVTSNGVTVNNGGSLTVGAGSTINMGNNIVGGVANGVADTDAVNVAQLKANTTTVVAGKNVSVDVAENASTGKTFTVNADKTTVSGTGPVSVKATSDAANHTTNYNVEFDSSKAAEQTDLTYKANGKDAKKVKLSEGLDFTNGKGTKASVGDNGKVTFDATVADVKQGDNVTINKDETTGVYTVNAKDTITTVKGKNGSAAKVTTATGSTDTNKIYEVDVNVDGKTIVNENGTLQAKGWKTKVVKGEGEVEGASEETVNGSDTVNYIAGKNVKLVQDGKNFTIATKDNVTFKDTTTTNLSVTPGGKVDMGNNKVTNVAEGTENTDAVNVKQLKDFKAEVADGGLTFAGNSGTAHKAKLNTTVNIKGGKDNTDATKFDNGKNVMTAVNGDTVTVSIKKTPEVEGINITDTTGNVKVKLTQTDEGLKVSDGNNNATRITNVKAGEKDTDAVNVKQLKAAKTEVEAGENIEITSRTDTTNGQTIYKVSAKGINDTSAAVKGGSDHVKVTKAANTHKDGSTTVTDYTVDLSNKTKEDIKKGVDAHTEVTTKGLTFNADKGTTGVKKLGSKVSVNGDGKNITTTADENGVKVSMKDDIKVNSVTTKEVKVGNVNINENGINAGGKRITNVAPGKDGTDAVNVNQLKYVAGNISNQINNVDKGLRAGIAGALASGGLYHATTSGKSMVSVGAGTYRGQNALAVGYSRLSDNGKVGVKFTVNSNSQGHAGASASVGYQW